MNLKIVPIGNSMGVRLPKTLLTHMKIENEVEVEIEDDAIKFRAVHHKPRGGWEEAFRKMAKCGDDKLIYDDFPNDFDKTDWKW